MAELSTVLREARNVIEDPQRWTQMGTYVDRDGRYCAVGAVYNARAGDVDDRVDARRLLDLVVGERMEHFNDHHTHAQVLAAFDRAIAEAEREEVAA